MTPDEAHTRRSQHDIDDNRTKCTAHRSSYVQSQVSSRVSSRSVMHGVMPISNPQLGCKSCVCADQAWQIRSCSGCSLLPAVGAAKDRRLNNHLNPGGAIKCYRPLLTPASQRDSITRQFDRLTHLIETDKERRRQYLDGGPNDGQHESRVLVWRHHSGSMQHLIAAGHSTYLHPPAMLSLLAGTCHALQQNYNSQFKT